MENVPDASFISTTEYLTASRKLVSQKGKGLTMISETSWTVLRKDRQLSDGGTVLISCHNSGDKSLSYSDLGAYITFIGNLYLRYAMFDITVARQSMADN